MPRARRPEMTSHDARRAAGSKPVVGSSRKMSSGSPMSASATSRRRRCPPESRVVCWSACSPRPASATVSSTSRGARVVARVELEALADGELDLRLGLLQHDADAVAQARDRRPRVVAEDADLAGVALRKPSRISTVVVLPAPFGPSSARISPRADLEIDAAHGLLVAVGLAQSLHLDRQGVVVGFACDLSWPERTPASGRCRRRTGRFRANPWVEAGCTPEPMTRGARRGLSSAPCPIPGHRALGRHARVRRGARGARGRSSLQAEPRPALHGEGLPVLAFLLAFLGAIVFTISRRGTTDRRGLGSSRRARSASRSCSRTAPASSRCT